MGTDCGNSGNRGCPCSGSASRELGRHSVGADQHGARVADDNTRLGLVLWRIGPQEERAFHTDAVLLPGVPYHHAMGGVRLQPVVRPGYQGLYRQPELEHVEPCGRRA